MCSSEEPGHVYGAGLLPRLCEGCDAIGCVMSRIIHSGADRERGHHLGGIRTEEGLEAIHLLDGRVEPEAVVLGGQDHRHPVVQGTEQVVRGGRQDRARVDGRPVPPSQCSHSPANPNGCPSRKWMRNGCLCRPSFFHS